MCSVRVFVAVERQLRVELLHSRCVKRQRGVRIAASARDQSDVSHRSRGTTAIKRGLRFFAEAVVFPVGDDANDFPERIVRPAEVEAFADRVLARDRNLRAKVSFTIATRVFLLVFVESGNRGRAAECPWYRSNRGWRRSGIAQR